MPKLITVVIALGLAAFAGPAFAQDEAPPPADAAPSADPGAEPSAAPRAEPAPAPTSDATTEGADAAEGTEGEAAPSDAQPSTQPADVSAPASQPADLSAPASQPADVAAPASQPAGDVDGGVDGTDTAEGADAGGGTLLSAGTPQPDVMERRLVAYVSTGVAAVALGTGITLGSLALSKYSCLNDVLACNEGLEQPIVGEGFLDQKAEVETLSLLADMAYVVAAAATIVAVTGYIRGYFLTDEDGAGEVTP